VRLLADENIPLAAVRALRAAGHDVAAIAEDESGLPDRAVLERAVSEQRILLTSDRDFGALIYRSRFPAPPGLIAGVRRTTRVTGRSPPLGTEVSWTRTSRR
jgi:predicted nuclease of predicted toxin-antitoxin system